MLRYIPIFMLAFALFSCSNNNNSENESISQDTTVIPTTSSTRVTITDTIDLNPDPASPEKRSPQTADSVRFLVAFISKGEGIDRTQKANLDAWLKNQKGADYSISPWGREGEMNYCFPLTNKSKSEQESFIRELKNQITDRDRVYFYENVPCSK